MAAADRIIQKRVGIIGGTFDPIHYGHLSAAEEARREFDLSEVVFIPAGEPPHKGHLLTSADDRYMMAVLATVGCPYFSVSRVEIDRIGKSYTTDTLKAMGQLPKYLGAEFYFIVGIDALLQVESWKEPQEILTLCKLVAVSRPGHSFDSLKKLPDKYISVIRTLEIPHLDISSTDIRERVRSGYGTKFLVPQPVEDYINKMMLYKEAYTGGMNH